LQKRKVLSLEWKSEGVMDDESSESMELMEFFLANCDNNLACPISVCDSAVLWLLQVDN